MGTRHTRLAAALSAAWVAELDTGRHLSALAGRAQSAGEYRRCARVSILAAFCRGHARRLLDRLAAMGRGPLPIPAEAVEAGPDVAAGLLADADFGARLQERYEQLAQLAREHCDLSSAWVCDLNRAEWEGMVRELRAMAEPPRPLAGRKADVIIIDDPLVETGDPFQEA